MLLTTDAVGGVLTYILDLAAGLADAGADVRIAVLGPRPSIPIEAARFDIVALDHPLEWLAASPDEVRAAASAIAAAAQGCDVVHLHSPAYAVTPHPCRVVAVHHSCVATWWAAVRGETGGLPDDLAWRAALVGEGMGRADAVLAPSHAHARAVAACYGLAAPPIVVRNGRATPRAAASAADAPAEDAGFVFTAGRLWDEGKNLSVLDRAAASLPWPVRAAGDVTGPNGAAVALAHIEPLGPCPPAKVRRLLAARPIYASPALYEPFGLAVLEAAQAGCPLVLADIPGFRELWDGAAVFTAPRDPAAWSDALGSLIADAPRRRALGEAARARSARYTAEAMVAGTLSVHAALLAGAPAATVAAA